VSALACYVDITHKINLFKSQDRQKTCRQQIRLRRARSANDEATVVRNRAVDIFTLWGLRY